MIKGDKTLAYDREEIVYQPISEIMTPPDKTFSLWFLDSETVKARSKASFRALFTFTFPEFHRTVRVIPMLPRTKLQSFGL